MKLLLDENLSPVLVRMLPAAFSGSQHVFDVEFGRKSDSNIWAYARANGFTILTKDSDFAERTLVDATGPKVVWLRIGNCTTDEVLELLLRREAEILNFESQGESLCLVLHRRRLAT